MENDYILKWNAHQTTLASLFDKLLSASKFTDCTISAGGKNVSAHKLLLIACSPYFESIFSGIPDHGHHAMIVLCDVAHADLQAIIEYMYRGEIHISEAKLSRLLKVAEALQIRGLYEPEENQTRFPPDPAPDPLPILFEKLPTGLVIEMTQPSGPNKTVFPWDPAQDGASCSHPLMEPNHKSEPPSPEVVSLIDNDAEFEGMDLSDQPSTSQAGWDLPSEASESSSSQGARSLSSRASTILAPRASNRSSSQGARSLSSRTSTILASEAGASSASRAGGSSASQPDGSSASRADGDSASQAGGANNVGEGSATEELAPS